MKLIENITKSKFYIPFLFILFLLLLASRRWMQLISPQVWDEDGSVVLYELINYGYISFLHPVNGYLITVPKIISAISLKISFSKYPLISTILTWIFIASIGLAIALAPTKLSNKILCAVAVFIVPTDPEVFGLPLYTFWWASILLFLVVLWDERDPSLGWRSIFLLIGGFSSPIIIMTLPIFYFRAYWYRKFRNEQKLALLATLVAIVQSYFILTWNGQSPSLYSIMINIIPKFFGLFLIGNLTNYNILFWIMGLLLICIISMWLLHDRHNITSWILAYLLIGAIFVMVLRVDPIYIGLRGGPRYFFFPFILIFWILIQFFHSGFPKWVKAFILVILVIALINAAPVWSRTHDDLNWEEHVINCGCGSDEYYSIPIHFDGNQHTAWSINMSHKTCSHLLKRDFFPPNKVSGCA